MRLGCCFLVFIIMQYNIHVHQNKQSNYKRNSFFHGCFSEYGYNNWLCGSVHNRTIEQLTLTLIIIVLITLVSITTCTHTQTHIHTHTHTTPRQTGAGVGEVPCSGRGLWSAAAPHYGFHREWGAVGVGRRQLRKAGHQWNHQLQHPLEGLHPSFHPFVFVAPKYFANVYVDQNLILRLTQYKI